MLTSYHVDTFYCCFWEAFLIRNSVRNQNPDLRAEDADLDPDLRAEDADLDPDLRAEDADLDPDQGVKKTQNKSM